MAKNATKYKAVISRKAGQGYKPLKSAPNSKLKRRSPRKLTMPMMIEVADRMARGLFLVEVIAENPKLPDISQFLDQLERKPELKEIYARAKELLSHYYFCSSVRNIESADNDSWRYKREQSSVYLTVAAKLNRKEYGDDKTYLDMSQHVNATQFNNFDTKQISDDLKNRIQSICNRMTATLSPSASETNQAIEVEGKSVSS